HLLDDVVLALLEAGCRRKRRGLCSLSRRSRARLRRGGGRSCPPLLLLPPDELQDVRLRHAAGDSAAVQLRDVDVVLFRDLANERRGPLPDGVFCLLRAALETRLYSRWCGLTRRSYATRAIALRRRLWRLNRFGCRRGGCLRCRVSLRFSSRADHGDDAVDRNRLAFLRADLSEDTGGRRRDFSVDLVGRNFEQRFVAIDFVANLLDPADDRALGNRLAHLGHPDVSRHRS